MRLLPDEELKQVKITFSFQLPYYIGLYQASDGSDRDCPSIEIPDGNIRIEHIEEKIPFKKSQSNSGGYQIIRKSIIHIEMLRFISDIRDHERWNCIEKIYVEAFKILISFLQLFRLRTREFVVKPTEICSPTSISEGPRHMGHLIAYNPRGIEKITVNCEPESSVGGKAIRDVFGSLVSEVLHGHDSACCNELKWQEIGQEFNTLLQDTSYQFDPDELLANELLTEAYRLVASSGVPPFPEDPFQKFQYPSPGICTAILNIAVACEIYVKGYVRKNGRPVYESIIEHHRDFTMPVTDYLDYVVKDIDGLSLKDKCKELWDNIELLFQLRNRIVHSGEAKIASNSGKKHQVMPSYVWQLGRSVEKMIEWLKSPDKCSFAFGDVPKIRAKITSRD